MIQPSKLSLFLNLLWALLLLSPGAYLFPAWSPQLGLQQASTPTPGAVQVFTPQAGQVLQGIVPVMVNTAVEGFISSELYFAYAADPTNTWFLLVQRSYIIENAAIASWDTSTISDGNYTLRLVVTAQDQSPYVIEIPNLRVRNYSPIETDTPTPSPTVQPGDLPTPTATVEPTFTPLPLAATPLPTNPASLNGAQVTASLGRGGLIALGLFLLVGLYLVIRRTLYGRH